jgi:RimJ/RimL family protein N-acetyltransferase
MLPRKLYSRNDKELVIEHLCSLSDEDKYLRFGIILPNTQIEKYVEKSWLASRWFGCFHGDQIIATCHAVIDNSEGELGCSVDEAYRGQGLAQLMFDRAVNYLRANGITNVYMHCLTKNAAMRHIATKNNMIVASSLGESDARVKVKPANPLTFYGEVCLDRMSVYDMLLKTHSDFVSNFYKY